MDLRVDQPGEDGEVRCVEFDGSVRAGEVADALDQPVLDADVGFARTVPANDEALPDEDIETRMTFAESFPVMVRIPPETDDVSSRRISRESNMLTSGV